MSAVVTPGRTRRRLKVDLQLASLPATLYLAVLTITAGVFFRPVFEAWSFLVPPLVGATIIALLVALACDHFALRNGESALLQLVAATLVLPGLLSLSEATFGLPLPKAIGQLFRALVDGPALLLTTPTPARSGQELLVAPVTSAWIGFVCGWLLYRSRKFSASVLGPTLAVICALAFGPSNSSFLGLVSAVYLLGVLLFVVYVSRTQVAVGRRIEWVDDRRSVIRPISMVAIAGVVGMAIGLERVVPSLGKADRFTLRTYRTPPFDPTDLPSPLAGYAKYLRDDMQKKLLFTAKGTDLPERWRVATLTTYDGRVWSVGKAADGGGTFALLGARLSNTKLFRSGWKRSETTISVAGLPDPFLPLPGPALTMSFPDDSNAAELDRFRNGVRYNAFSDTLITTDKNNNKGRTYKIQWARFPSIDPASLAGRNLGEPLQEQLPPSRMAAKIGSKANEWAGSTEGWDAVARLKASLDQGFYSRTAPPGHSYGDLARLLTNESSLVGNGEHYAALLGVLARTKGIASRVVVGFVPPKAQSGSQRVYGRDIRAWVEVSVADAGWIPVDLIQDPNKKPLPKQTKASSTADQTPPPPNTVPAPEPEALQIEPSKKKNDTKAADHGGLGVPVPVLVGSGIGLGSLALLASFIGGVALLKGSRRRRRRAGDPRSAISGAWEEVLERSIEAGERPLPGRTFVEYGGELFSGDEKKLAILGEIADLSDRATFHPSPPSAETSALVWLKVDELRSLLSDSASTVTRVRRAGDPRPLLRGSVRDAFSR